MVLEMKRKKDRKMTKDKLALMVPTSMAAGLFIGYWLDKWLGTHPLMVLVFALLGIIFGFNSVLSEVNKYKDK